MRIESQILAIKGRDLLSASKGVVINYGEGRGLQNGRGGGQVKFYPTKRRGGGGGQSKF